MAAKRMNGSEIVIKALVDQGVEVVFGYPGGAVLPIYDALFQQNALRHILVRQELGAAHMAEGYARSTGKVGVILVTSGPGATNTVTGLTDALMDSIPIICLTGQVPTHLIGNDAFQEADTTGITRACTKHNYLVKDIDELALTMHEAFHVARSGRPGPVVIDLPKDILQGLGPYFAPDEFEPKRYKPKRKGDPRRIEEAVELIANAKRPLFYCGGGVINSGPRASKLLTEFVKLTGYPITLTLMGLGAYPGTDKQYLGLVGMHGSYESNLAMHGCDVMIDIGARFDDRVTGKLSAFSPGSKKIHVDIDPSSLNKTVRVDVPIVGDCASVLADMIRVWKERKAKPDAKALKAWWAEIARWQRRNCFAYDTTSKLIKPQQAIERLYAATRGRDVYITTEVGQHQMWAAQLFKFDKPNHWMTSGGLGTMGYGMPAAIGVQVAHPDALVIDIAGEASFMMNIQEMSTAAQYRLPIKVFILNNQYMGMIRQWQELLHGSRYSECYMDSLPDFVKLAESFGAVGLRAERPDQLDDVIAQMLAADNAVIADIRVDPAENCFPMIPSGAAHNEILLGPEDQAAKPISEEGMVLV
jgi:acetolactate synthase I/II/III large subunit